jgi:hypothetical protein
MAESKLTIKVGPIEFAGEGEGSWLSEQLEKVLDRVPELIAIAPLPRAPEASGSSEANGPINGVNAKTAETLPAFLKSKNATTSQVTKFLATSVWLHDRTGRARLSTGDVAKALKDTNQTKLTNPSECLNKNVGKGFCEKDSTGYFVTDPGRESLEK